MLTGLVIKCSCVILIKCKMFNFYFIILMFAVLVGSSSKPSIDHTHPLKSTDIDVEIRKGMSEKKLHEVCHMTSLIDHVTRKSCCNAVVDVGSGLVGIIMIILNFEILSTF